MSKRDYYEVLGVARNVDEKQLKSAFRKLAMEFHPDRNPDNPDAEKKFKEIGEAYEILKDAEKRAAYDRYGHAAFEGGGGGGRSGGAGFSGFEGGFSSIFDEIFGDFMGGSSGRRGRSGRGADLRFNYELTLEECFNGKEAEITVPTQVSCDECAGSGAAKNSKIISCGTCNGHGKVRATQGFFSVERTCPTCKGRGEQIENPCNKCHGNGRVNKERKLAVNIPAGVEEGTRIRVSGEGEAGIQGAPSGDLYLFVSIIAHEFFAREGANLHCRVPISMATAALGGSFEVPTIDGGTASVKVPEGTQSGKQFRLRGKGMSVLNRNLRGDLYVQIIVETPKKLTKRQRELLEEFQNISVAENSPDSESFLNRIRDLF